MIFNMTLLGWLIMLIDGSVVLLLCVFFFLFFCLFCFVFFFGGEVITLD